MPAFSSGPAPARPARARTVRAIERRCTVAFDVAGAHGIALHDAIGRAMDGTIADALALDSRRRAGRRPAVAHVRAGVVAARAALGVTRRVPRARDAAVVSARHGAGADALAVVVAGLAARDVARGRVAANRRAGVLARTIEVTGARAVANTRKTRTARWVVVPAMRERERRDEHGDHGGNAQTHGATRVHASTSSRFSMRLVVRRGPGRRSLAWASGSAISRIAPRIGGRSSLLHFCVRTAGCVETEAAPSAKGSRRPVAGGAALMSDQLICRFLCAAASRVASGARERPHAELLEGSRTNAYGLLERAVKESITWVHSEVLDPGLDGRCRVAVTCEATRGRTFTLPKCAFS